MSPQLFRERYMRDPLRDPRDYITHIPRKKSNLSYSYTAEDAENELHDITDMSLPGLGLDEPEEQSAAAYGSSQQSQTQTYDLQKETEWRFEVVIGRVVTIRALEGRPEIYGTELVIGRPYTFHSSKAAVWTWIGCKFEVTSDYGPLSSALTSEYVAEETPAFEHFNIHVALEKQRQGAADANADGPCTLTLGPPDSGKTTLAKTLTGYALRAGRGPLVVNLNPSEGLLSVPGTLTATVFKTVLEIEQGWGNAPMSGPNGEIPVKIPLVYYYGSMTPEDKAGAIYKAQIKQLALDVLGRMKDDSELRSSGLLIDTPGSLVYNKSGQINQDIVAGIVSEFGVTSIVCLGTERQYSDLLKRFDGLPTSRPVAQGHEVEKITVVKATKSGGVVERDTTYMRAIREAQVKSYFYGTSDVGPGIVLQPRQQQVEFNTITVWRRISATGSQTTMSYNNIFDDKDEFRPGGAEDEENFTATRSSVPLPASQIFERLTSPIPALRNCVLAVMNCERDPEAGTEQTVLRDSTAMGFLYVTDVDEARGRISVLSPQAGRVPERALVWAEDIEGILGLA